MSDTAERVVTEAQTWIGTPYRHQASLKGVGCDCLGLVRGVWREVYGSEPEALKPYGADWAEAGGADSLMDAARRHFVEKSKVEMSAGDVIVFRWKPTHIAKHAGILDSTDSFIHAYEGHAVMRSSLVPQWRSRIAGVFAFKPREAPAFPLAGKVSAKLTDGGGAEDTVGPENNDSDSWSTSAFPAPPPSDR